MDAHGKSVNYPQAFVVYLEVADAAGGGGLRCMRHGEDSMDTGPFTVDEYVIGERPASIHG